MDGVQLSLDSPAEGILTLAPHCAHCTFGLLRIDLSNTTQLRHKLYTNCMLKDCLSVSSLLSMNPAFHIIINSYFPRFNHTKSNQIPYFEITRKLFFKLIFIFIFIYLYSIFILIFIHLYLIFIFIYCYISKFAKLFQIIHKRIKKIIINYIKTKETFSLEMI